MKPQQPKNIKFIPFNDGLCSIYTEDEEENKIYKVKNIRFSKKTLGYGRYYTAKSTNVKVDRVILIPQLPIEIDSNDYLEIEGNLYHIELVQEIDNSNPKTLQLTLRKLDI